jgi:hypothetical protein
LVIALPDFHQGVTGAYEETVTVFSTVTSEYLRQLEGYNAGVESLGALGGNVVLPEGSIGSMRAWDVSPGRLSPFHLLTPRTHSAAD